MIWEHIGWYVLQDRPQAMPRKRLLKPFLRRVLAQARRNGRRLDPDRVYCTYGLRDGRDRHPFYVGKGTRGRPVAHLESKALLQNSPKNDTILKIFAERQTLYIEIFFRDVSEATALALEMFLVDHFGRMDLGTGCLTNQTHGGDGQSGKVWTKESRDRRRVAAKSWWDVPENRLLIQQMRQAPEDMMRSKLAMWQPLFLLVQPHVQPRWSRVMCRCCGGVVDMKNVKLLNGVLPRNHRHCADSIFEVSRCSGVYGKSGSKGVAQLRFPTPNIPFRFSLTMDGIRFTDYDGNELSRVQLPREYLEVRLAGERRLRR